MRRTIRVILLVLLFSAPLSVFGAFYTWTGAINNVWENAGNWAVGPTYPGDGGSTIDVATIAGAGTPNITTDTITVTTLSLTGSSILTDSSGNDFTVLGTATLDGDINMGGASNIALNNITLSGNSQITTVTGGITVTGTADGNFDFALNAGSGDFTLTASSFGPNINNLDFITTSAAGQTLPAINIDGNLTVSGAGNILNELNVTIDVVGNADVTSGGLLGLDNPINGTITLGSFTFSGNNVRLNETNGTDLAGGTSAGPLNIQSGGNISNTGNLDITGVSTFTAPNGSDIILQSAGNQFVGDVTLSSGGTLDDVRITDTDGTGFNVQAGLTIGDDFLLNIAGDIVFLGGFTTAVGPVDLTASAGITGTVGALSVPNDVTTLSAGGLDAINLSNAGNDFGTISVAAGGDTYIVDINGVILGDMIPGVDDLRLDVDGAVTQLGGSLIRVGGLALEGTGPFELMEALNEIDLLAFNVTNQVDVRDGDGDGFVVDTVQTVALASAATVVLRNDGAAATQNNPIATTNLLLQGAGNFTLNNAANAVTTIASNSTGNQSYTDSTALDVGSVTPQTGGAVNGISSAGGDVTLNTLAGALTINQAVNVGAGNLNLTTVGGSITQGAGDTITSSGTAAINSDGGGDVITLDQAVNNFGTLVLDGTTVEIQEADALVLGNVNAASTFELDADGAVTQSGVTTIQTTDLLLLGNGSFTLPNNNNTATIAANVGGAISFTDVTANLAVGTVLGTNGITTTADTVILDAQAGSIAVNQVINTAAGLGNIELTASTTIDLDAALTAGTGDVVLDAGAAVNQTVEVIGAGLLLAGAGPFNLTDVDNDIDSLAGNAVIGLIDFIDTDGFNLDTVQAVPGISSTADVKLSSGAAVGQTAGADITSTGLLLLGTGPYELMEANDINTLAFNVTNQVDFRDVDGFALNTVQAVALATTGNDLVLQNDAGTVTQGNPIITGGTGGLLLRGAGDFTLTNNSNTITTIASDATGNLSYTDTAGYEVGSVTPQTGGAVNGISSAGGDVTLNTLAGALTINQAVNVGAGNLNLTTVGGSITQGAGDTITSSGTATINSDGGGDVITLDQAVNNFGTLVLDGTTVEIQEADALVLGNVNAASTFELDADGAVTQSGVTTIQTTDLLLLGTGSFTLPNNNNTATIAANVGGAISFTDVAANLAIGTVLGTNGITTTADTVILDAQAGSIAVNQVINTAAGLGNIELTASTTIDLDAALTAGTGDVVLDAGAAVNQTVEVIGAGLLLAGAGPFNLTDVDNDIDIIAADSVSGLVDFQDADGFSVGTVQAVVGVITTTANVDTVSLVAIAGNITIDNVLTTSASAITVTAPGNLAVNAAVSSSAVGIGDIDFTAGGTVTIANTVSSGLGDVIIDADGAVTQTAVVSGTGLQLLGDGPFNLSTQDNLFTDLAAAVTAGGTLAYNDGNAINITNVGGTNGITTAAADITVSTTAGGILVTQSVTTGTGTAGDVSLIAGGGGGTIALNNTVTTGNGDLTLNAGAAVTQTAVFTDVTGLELLGAGPFTLNFGAGNEVANLSANVSGDVNYIDQDALSLTTVGVTTGATMGGAVLNLETINGGLTIAQAVVSGGGNIIFDVGSTAGGTLAVNASMTLGAGDLTITSTDNQTQTAGGAITTGGTTTLTSNAGAADIHFNLAANAFGTLAATGDEVRIRQVGAALDLANIDASIFTLDSDSAVTQTAGIIDDTSGTNDVMLIGAGPFRLIQAANDIGTLAANITGDMTYRDVDGFTVGSVTATLPPTTVNGITGAAGVAVSLRADALLTQTQPVITPELQLLGAGPFNFDAVVTNDVDIIAANVTGQLDFEDTDALAIGSVTNTEAVNIDGITTNGSLLDLVAGGNITIDMPVATGAGQILVFDAGGTIFFSEVQAAATISTDNAAGITLNDPIILEENSSLTTSAGDITLGAAASVNDDVAGGSEYTLLISSGNDISLGADIGATTPPVDLTLTAAGGDGNPAVGTDVTVSQDFIVSGGTTYNMTAQSVTAGRDISVAGIIDITGAASVSATQDIVGAGSFTVTGTATVSAGRNIGVNAITVGDVAGVATFNVGQNFTTTFTPGDNADDSDTDSTVIFNNVTAGGSGTANSFHNLTINDPGNIITSTGDWTVYGALTLTDGTWTLGANTHTVWGSWNSTLNAFAFNPAGSTVVFDGGTDATLRTDGIGTENFNNIVFDKSSTNTVSLSNVAGNTLEVLGNLGISDGRFSARNGATPGFNIQITGNWADTTTIAGDGFIHQNGEVFFVGAASILNPGTGITPYLFDVTVTDSNLILNNDALVVGNDLTINAAAGAATLTANQALTINGDLDVNAAADDVLFTSNAVFTSNGSVLLQGPGLVNGPRIDFTDDDFHFDGGADSLDNSVGEIRLDGQQAVQDFPSVTAGSENLYGLVTYYDGGADGQIVQSTHLAAGNAWFWNLVVDMPNRDLTMAADVTVWGWNLPAAFSNTPGPVDPTNLNGVRILNGTLNAELNPVTQYDLRIYGMMLTTNATPGTGTRSYRWGTAGNELADPNGATVEFLGANPAYIEGDNLFFRFLVNTGVDPRTAVPLQPSDPAVAGKIFYFEAGSNTTVYDDPDARFIVVGNDIIPDDGAQDADWISLLSGTDGVFWAFNKLANAVAIMKYVYVQDSNALANPIVLQPRVIVANSPGWVDFVYVTISTTRDQLNSYTGTADAVNELPTIDNSLYEPDGRIDRILVQVQAAVVKDFSGFIAEVDGYNILGYDPGDTVGDYEFLSSSQFWIILEEGDYLDTAATPAWRILDNTTLIDSSTGAPVSIYSSKNQEIPNDGAPPIIGYTLSVADSIRDEVFVHFSEPVVDDTAGAEITAANFATAVGGGVASVTRVTPFPAPADNGMQEAVLNLSGPVTVADITGNALNLTVNNVEDIPTPLSPLADDAGDAGIVGPPPGLDVADPLLAASHRISDLAVGILGNGIVEPVAAVGQTQPAGGTGVGIITVFDGTDFLQVEDINLQAHRYTGELFTPELYWDNAKTIPESYKNAGLWLPFVEEIADSGNRPFSGLVPRPWNPGPINQIMVPVAGDLFDHDWTAGGKIVNNADLDFFFRIDGGGAINHLYAARCEDDTASDWYRHIRPWRIMIRNVVTQAGGISILNNIINPNRNEFTTLHYELNQSGMVSVQVFDLAGGLVEVLQRGYQTTGEYSVSWNGRNRSGNVVARGIYFVRYVGPGGIDQIRKILVVK